MKFSKKLYIKEKLISEDSPTFIIAEAGVNHGGDIIIAKKMIDLAVEAQADAVKFQSFNTENLILSGIQKANYQKKTTNSSESQFDMLKKLEISKEQSLELKSYCENKGIIFLTTPFDEFTLEELDDLMLSAYKVASTDITNLPFLRKIAKKGKPIFLSSGMSYLSEVKLALEAIYEFNKEVILFQCTANYPTKDSEVNLEVINTYKKNFDILLGFSDHSVGTGAAPFAIPMGAKVIEKHFTIDKNSKGPDHAASLSPEELIEFVKIVRKVDKYMGDPVKQPSLSELINRKSLQKCLVATKEIKKGSVFSEKNLIAKRTGGVGISPINLSSILGRKSIKDFKKDEVISID
jgi:N,N'-diacetyllegionaminate synthase